MVPVRYAVVLMAVLFLAASASAQQQRTRRVLTNEDVASPAPSAPAPEPAAKAAPSEPAAEKAPSAEAKPAEAAPDEAEPAQEKPFSELEPKERLKKITGIQEAFKTAMDVFSDRENKETDATRKTRWRNLTFYLSGAMQANQELITEIQSEVQAQEPTPQPPSPSAPSPQ